MRFLKKVFKKILWLFFLSSILFLMTMQFTQCSGWTFLTYMQSDENLLYWALRNMNDMTIAQKDKDINVLVHLHTKDNIAFRYRIENGAMHLEDMVTIENDCVKDVVSAMQWAVSKYQAEHYCLTLWNHGFGILDPIYVESDVGHFDWVAEPQETDLGCSDGACSLKCFDFHNIPLKGTLFNFYNKTYMTNEKMVDTLSQISQNVLHGKKLDILGTDCCKMAMLEIGYQISDYVGFLVGSQNCELVDGWNYKGFFDVVTHHMSSEEVVKAIVDSYYDYYQKNTTKEIYTLSALNLEKIDPIIDDVNNISVLLQTYLKEKPDFTQNLYDIRYDCVSICDAPFYTDLDSFYVGLLEHITKEIEDYQSNAALNLLVDALGQAREHIQSFVSANCTGKNMTRAQGCSIYFPRFHIDSSYLKTSFAQNTQWLTFLDNLIYGF